MKSISLFFATLLYAGFTFAQRTVPLRDLWTEPQVHVLFEGYTVSFTVCDIDRTLALLAETGDSLWGAASGLDTAKQYTAELYPGYNTEYQNSLQPLLQKGVGAFLLSEGRATIENPRHRSLDAVVVDVQPADEGENEMDVKFYDPASGKILFDGMLLRDIAGRDIGLE